MEIFSEDELVITPAMSEQKVASAPGAVTVITEEQIKAMGARTLSDVLRTVTGVYISTSERHLERIWIRGIRSGYNDKTLLLIDGVPQRELVYGHMFIDEYIPVGNIERIEVVRGPGSALYGTNAFAGVVNVITKDTMGITVRSGFGTCATKKFTAEAGEEFGPLKVNIFSRLYETEGDGTEFSDYHERHTLQQDPVKANSFWVKSSIYGLQLNAKYLFYQHKFPTHPDVPAEQWDRNWFWYKNSFLDLSYEYKIGENISALARGYWQHYDNPSFWQVYESYVDTLDGIPLRDYVITYDVWPYKKSQLAGGQVRFNLSLPLKHQVILGGEYDYEEIIEVRDLYKNRVTGDTVSPYVPDTAEIPYDFYIAPMTHHNYTWYIQDIWNPKELIGVTIGVRNDVHDVFGSSINPRGGVVVGPLKKIIVKLLYGQAFRAPSYRELYTYSANPSWIQGNPDLKPEMIKTPEIELDYDITKNIRTRMNYYRSYCSDLIFRNYSKVVDGDTVVMYDNSEKDIEVQGLEGLLKVSFRKLAGFFNYTYSEAKEEYSDKTLFDLPCKMSNFGLTYRPYDNLSLNTTISWVDSRPRRDDDENIYNGTVIDPRYPDRMKRPDVPGYTTVNLTLQTRVKDFAISASVYNLLNQIQYDADYKSTQHFDIERPGRNFYLEISYKL
jgi:iron complex outermembrane receptor protein